jgi:hypothetical protein
MPPVSVASRPDRSFSLSAIIESMTEPDVRETAPEEPNDPNDSDLLRDELKGKTTEHAKPPRLEDEGQSGG